MKSFTSAVLLASVASVMASPVEKRADALQCESTPRISNRITTPNTDPNAHFPTVFSLGNYTTKDHFGKAAKLLTSLKDDGTPYTIQKDPQSLNFDFYACNSTYMNTKPTGEYKNELLYGIIKPHGQTQHCLQTASGSVDTLSQEISNSYCSFVDDNSQQQQTWSYFPNDGLIKFISTRLGEGQHPHPTYFTLMDDAHKSLQLNAGSQDGITLSFAPGA